VPGHPYEQGFDLRLVPEKVLEPARWTAPKMVFVNSMSDLFHQAIPDSYIDAVSAVMSGIRWHTYQVLTKRAQRLRSLLSNELRDPAACEHIWWGVSVEDRKYGIPRIEELRLSPATVRFLSIEPLLEDLGEIDLRGIHWVIVGGESGRGARPLRIEWVSNILEQCQAAGVPFFFKQWGGVQKKRTGRLLNGRTYDEFPLVKRSPFPEAKVRKSIVSTLETDLVAKRILSSVRTHLPVFSSTQGAS
jgi:protein gp37